jgi:serine/threonine protein kinase
MEVVMAAAVSTATSQLQAAMIPYVTDPASFVRDFVIALQHTFPGQSQGWIIDEHTWNITRPGDDLFRVIAWSCGRILGQGSYKTVYEGLVITMPENRCQPRAIAIANIAWLSLQKDVKPADLIARITCNALAIMEVCQQPDCPLSLASRPDYVFVCNYWHLVIIQPPYEMDLLAKLYLRRTSYLDLIRYLVQVMEALAYLHSHSILHRGVRAQNILIRGEQAALAGWNAVTTRPFCWAPGLSNVDFPYGDTSYRQLQISTLFTDIWGFMMTAGGLFFRDFSVFSNTPQLILTDEFDQFLMRFMVVYLEKWKTDPNFPVLTEEFATPEQLIEKLMDSTLLAQYCGAHMQMLCDIHRLIRRCAEFDKQLFELFKVIRPSIDNDIKRIYQEAVSEWDPEQEVLRELQRIQEDYKKDRESLQPRS